MTREDKKEFENVLMQVKDVTYRVFGNDCIFKELNTEIIKSATKIYLYDKHYKGSDND